MTSDELVLYLYNIIIVHFVQVTYYNFTLYIKNDKIIHMEIIKASDARQNFQDVIDTVYYKETPTVILKRKKPWVVIQSIQTLDKKTQEKILNDIEKNLF